MASRRRTVNGDDRTTSLMRCSSHTALSKCPELYEKMQELQNHPSPCATYEKVQHCNAKSFMTNHTGLCNNLLKHDMGKLVFDVKSHYTIPQRHNHGPSKLRSHSPEYYSPREWSSVKQCDQIHADVVIDARCNFKWPHIYFHTIADCQLGIFPALYAFFERYPNITAGKSVVLIVDNSTKSLCDSFRPSTPINSSFASDKRPRTGTSTTHVTESRCMFTNFKRKIQGRRSLFRCLNTINLDHWRSMQLPVILADDVIWLQARKETFAFDNTVCLHEFRLLYLSEFCTHCPATRQAYGYDNILSVAAASTTLTAKTGRDKASDSRNVILMVRRPKDSARHIPEFDTLVVHLKSAFPTFLIRNFYGNESLCETVALFHSARIVIGAHGSGIVNTVFCRVDTFLLEITSKHTELHNPGPWRTNVYKAVEVGLTSRIYLIPHKGGVTDRDLQLRLQFHLDETDFKAIESIIGSYLRNANLARLWGVSKDNMRTSQYFYDNFVGYLLVNRSTTVI